MDTVNVCAHEIRPQLLGGDKVTGKSQKDRKWGPGKATWQLAVLFQKEAAPFATEDSVVYSFLFSLPLLTHMQVWELKQKILYAA